MRHVRHGSELTRQERQELVSVLAALPTLQDCAPAELKELASSGTSLTVPASWTAVQEGTPGDSCYLVLDGEARVTRSGEQVALLAPGALFGEVGLLDARLRSATVTAQTRLRLLRLEHVNLLRLITNQPHLADALLADYRRRVGATS